MLNLPHTKSRYLTNTPTRCGPRCRRLHVVPLQLLTSRHISPLSEHVLQKFSFHSQYAISKASWWSPRRLVVKITLTHHLKHVV